MKILRRENISFSQINFGGRAREEYGDIDDLALAIENLGLLHPLVVDKDYNLVAGGRRFKAIEKLGWREVPVAVAEIDNPSDAKEAELVENLARKNLTWPEQVKLVQEVDAFFREKNEEWTQDKTGEVLDKGHGTVNYDLQLARAIESVPELANCKTKDEAYRKWNALCEKLAVDELRERQKKREEEESAEEKESLETRKYREAQASYMIGDVFEGLASLENARQDIIFCEVDPPYGVALEEQKMVAKESYTEGYVEIKEGDYIAFLERLTAELYRILPVGCTFVFWFGIEWYREVQDALTTAGFDVDSFPAIWNKGHGQTNRVRTRLARTYETFFYGMKPGGDGLGINKQGRSLIFDYGTVGGKQKRHPTQKPIPLLQEILSTFCTDPTPGKTILIPFMGSGATYFAARELGYKAFGWDLYEEYKERFLVALTEEYINRMKVE